MSHRESFFLGTLDSFKLFPSDGPPKPVRKEKHVVLDNVLVGLAINDINLVVAKGGSGKTVLLKALTNKLDDALVIYGPAAAQFPSSYLTVRQSLELIVKTNILPDYQKDYLYDIETVIKDFNLKKLAFDVELKPKFSYGSIEKSLYNYEKVFSIFIASLVITKPKYLLIDEVDAFLLNEGRQTYFSESERLDKNTADNLIRSKILEVLKIASKYTTVVFSSNYPGTYLLEKNISCITIESGKVYSAASPDELSELLPKESTFSQDLIFYRNKTP